MASWRQAEAISHIEVIQLRLDVSTDGDSLCGQVILDGGKRRLVLSVSQRQRKMRRTVSLCWITKVTSRNAFTETPTDLARTPNVGNPSWLRKRVAAAVRSFCSRVSGGRRTCLVASRMVWASGPPKGVRRGYYVMESSPLVQSPLS